MVIYLNHFVIYLKLTEHCKLPILQLKKSGLKKKNELK